MKFKRVTIDVHGLFGTNKIPALQYNTWATYQLPEDPSLWVINFVPFGFNLPPDWCSFKSARQAAKTIVDIDRLKNSWHVATQDDFTPGLRDRLKEIAKRHGAVEGPLSFQVVEGQRTLRRAA